jgi:rhodanese-related sulfurtransferase
MTPISPRQLHDRLQRDENLPLLDVRTPAEHAEIHVPGVHLVSLDRLDATTLAGVKHFAKDKPLYIFCRSGERAQRAADKLAKHGYHQCHVVEGGTVAWAEAGLPVARGTNKVISLERQVRIAAGSIVLTGVLLAHFVNPAFLWLSGFVGAGLVFAGITDWCGMGMLIAKLPWNQRGSDTGSTKLPV